jgi:hypothetical protein
VGQFSRQALQGPVAGDVALEGAGDERCPFGVGHYASDLAAAHDLAPVDVAERGAVGEAALLHLLVEALLDLVGQVGRVELGHQGVDALDQASRGGLFHVLGDRDQCHAAPAEQRTDGHVVLHVAGQPVDLVDDHCVDVTILGDAGQHRLKRRAVGAAGRLAPVDVLVGELPSGVSDVAAAGLALGRDGAAFIPFAFLGLLAGGHPQVDHTAHRLTLLRFQHGSDPSIRPPSAADCKPAVTGRRRPVRPLGDGPPRPPSLPTRPVGANRPARLAAAGSPRRRGAPTRRSPAPGRHSW